MITVYVFDTPLFLIRPVNRFRELYALPSLRGLYPGVLSGKGCASTFF